MTDAPEHIWAGVLTDEYRGMTGTRIRVWGDDPRVGTDDPAIEYIRADLVEALEAENQQLREALRPFGDAADHAIESVGKTTTLGVLGALAPYFVIWQDFNRARAALRSTEASHDD